MLTNKKQMPPIPRQVPDAKGVAHTNDVATNTQEQGQSGNIHQNTTRARNQQDR